MLGYYGLVEILAKGPQSQGGNILLSRQDLIRIFVAKNLSTYFVSVVASAAQLCVSVFVRWCIWMNWKKFWTWSSLRSFRKSCYLSSNNSPNVSLVRTSRWVILCGYVTIYRTVAYSCRWYLKLHTVVRCVLHLGGRTCIILLEQRVHPQPNQR